MRPSAASRASAGVAAALTIGIAVGMDVAAGEHLLHTATIGLIAVLLALLRVRLGGAYEGCFALLSGAIVAQPALHAMTKLVSVDTGPLTGHAAETSVSMVPVLLTGLVVVTVVGAQWLFSLFAERPLAALLLLLVSAPIPAGVFASRVWPAGAAIVPRRYLTITVPRRGPPFSRAAAA
jgi:hypothetical protein